MAHSACPLRGEREHWCEFRLGRDLLLWSGGRRNDGAERTEEALMLYELAQIIVLSKDLHPYPSASPRLP
jgi:hypothetical protein